MWNKVTRFLSFLAVLGGCWAFVFNPNGVLDTLAKTWPSVNTDWLSILGIVVLVAILILYPIHLVLDILHSIRSRSETEDYREISDIQHNLSTLQVFFDDLFPRNHDVAQANVIVNKLVSQKVLHPQIGEINPEKRSAYISYVSNVIDQFSLQDAISNKDQIFKNFANDASN